MWPLARWIQQLACTGHLLGGKGRDDSNFIFQNILMCCLSDSTAALGGLDTVHGRSQGSESCLTAALSLLSKMTRLSPWLCKAAALSHTEGLRLPAEGWMRLFTWGDPRQRLPPPRKGPWPHLPPDLGAPPPLQPPASSSVSFWLPVSHKFFLSWCSRLVPATRGHHLALESSSLEGGTKPAWLTESSTMKSMNTF